MLFMCLEGGKIMVNLGCIKDENELENLTIDELIILYFKTIKEINTPSIKFKGSPIKPNYMQIKYEKEHQNQALKVIQLLKNNKVKTNYFYLKYKYIKLKIFRR